MKRAVNFLLVCLILATICLMLAIILHMDSISLLRPAAIKSSSMIIDSAYEKYANLTRKHCGESFSSGELCPKLYTELGGRCDLNNDTFHCPDIRNYSKFLNRQAQLVLTRMLRIFDLLAQKHEIFYWIARGTLLGAARHRGFVPWDGDADIEIPLDDYIKFFQVAAKELPADIFFQNSISDPALHPNQSWWFHKHAVVGIYQETWNPRLRDRNSCYKYCMAHACKWHDGLMVDIFVLRRVYSPVYPLKRLPFEGFTLPVQNNWKEELESLYGEYWFEFPEDRSPSEHPDVFNGCEKLKS